MDPSRLEDPYLYLYTRNNPINYTDPSGLLLDPHDPTQRGTIIHKMIQAKYQAENPMGTQIEVPVPGESSLHGRSPYRVKYNKEDGLWSIINRTLKQPETLIANGKADIIDWDISGLYEIKPLSARGMGELTVAWYIFNFNEQSEGLYSLTPGTRFYPPPGIIVGTDPADNSKWIMAELSPDGVIVYWDRKKRDNRDPVPVYVYEWNPRTAKAEPRRGSITPVPDPRPVLVFCAGIATAVIIADPLLGDEGLLPWIWHQVASTPPTVPYTPPIYSIP